MRYPLLLLVARMRVISFMFEDGWPTDREIWYDEDFNDVVFEYDLKVTECQDEERMAIQGSKEELLLTLDVRAVGGMYPTTLGFVLSDFDSKDVDRITARAEKRRAFCS